MKKAIYEYIELSKQEKENLWESATFVFDTNVLLNLYRYTSKTRDSLFQAIAELKDRIWMPHHVAEEFMKDRYSVFFECCSAYSDIKKKKDEFLDFCTSKLRLNETDPQIIELKKKIDEWISNLEKQDPRVHDFSHDDILEKILSIFDGKTGEGFNNEDILSIEKIGKDRYAKKIPPGYLDHQKAENTYGDLIIWKEIVHFAKENRKDIIFITDDQKEDWWNVVKGKTIGPRPELRKEFYNETENRRFHMYSMRGFLTYSMHRKSVKIDDEIIDDIGTVSKEYEFTVKDKEGSDIFSGTDSLLLYKRHLKEKLVLLSDKLEEEKERRADFHRSRRQLGTDVSSDLGFLLAERQLDDSIQQKEKEIKRIEDELSILNGSFIISKDRVLDNAP